MVDDPERFLKRHSVLVRILVMLPVGEDESLAGPVGSRVHGVLAGIALPF
ncbi:hypothetical protein ACFVW5_07605 [Streptomyces sp. NPDC058232]